MNSTLKQNLAVIVKNVSQFFELDIQIKLFGVPVFKFHWPPQSNVEPQIN